MRYAIPFMVMIFLFPGAAVMGVSGCAGTNPNSSPDGVKEFFRAGKEAQYLALQSPASGFADLSAYEHLVGVKYPPNSQVEVLRKPPSRPYQSFAVVEFEPAPHSRPEEAVEGLKGKAMELGADAIILPPSGADQGPSGIPPKGKIQAVAIKYM